MTFGCTKCAACCRFAAHLRSYEGPEWPLNDDGSCGHLAADGTCAIYEHRPVACRIADMRPHDFPEDEWLARNADACETLQAFVGLDVAVWRPTILPAT